MEKIKVLQLVSPGFGGIETYVFNHYRYMDREKFQFDFLTQNPNLEGAEQYQDLQYKVHLLKTSASQDRSLFERQVKDIFKSGYDVLHLNTCYWTGFLLEELAKDAGIKKVIVHSHSSFIDEPDEEKRRKLLSRHEDVKRAFHSDLATDFWACSWKAADWLFGPQIPRNEIRILKNAIELERFRFDQSARNRVRTQLGVDKDTLVLGTTGRLTFSKNHRFLIEVFRNFHIQHTNSKLIIIGSGELQSNLKTQIRESGLEDSVSLLGWRNNVEDYLSAMDCFLLPSRFEGLGIAAVEASGSGLPCILSDQVPQDVAFTEHVRYVPLNIQAWNDALEEMAWLQVDRHAGIDVVRAAGYDVREQAKVLESLYEM